MQNTVFNLRRALQLTAQLYEESFVKVDDMGGKHEIDLRTAAEQVCNDLEMPELAEPVFLMLYATWNDALKWVEPYNIGDIITTDPMLPMDIAPDDGTRVDLYFELVDKETGATKVGYSRVEGCYRNAGRGAWMRKEWTGSKNNRHTIDRVFFGEPIGWSPCTMEVIYDDGQEAALVDDLR